MKSKSIHWAAISAIGQLLSGIAVALTLLYLTLQLRHSEIAASDANRLVRANGVVNYWLAAAHDPEFREVGLRITRSEEWIKEVARRLELTESDATQLESSANYWFWLHWGQWNTTTEEKDIAELTNMVRRFYTLPQIRLMWEGHRGWMDSGFEAFVDGVLAEADADPSLDPQMVDLESICRRLDELGIGLPSQAKAAAEDSESR